MKVLLIGVKVVMNILLVGGEGTGEGAAGGHKTYYHFVLSS